MTILTPPNKTSHQAGSVFVIILMAVVLFGALAFVVSRSMQSQTTGALTKREAEIAATDIITYAQRVARAVDKVRGDGCSENDISFENDVVAGYDHAVAPPDKCQIFLASGVGITWQTPASGVNNGDPWFFSDSLLFTGHGGAGTSDLVMILPNVSSNVCLALNAMLGVALAADPPVSADAPGLVTKARGTFAASATVIGAGTAGFTGLQAACFTKAGANHFYMMLLPR